MLRIGFSACFFHSDPQRRIFKGKTLLYLEESLAHWVAREGAIVSLIPTLPEQSPLEEALLVRHLDGLILQGGDDVAPESYGEKPLRLEWKGDAVRDAYEISLIKEFLKQEKPILGICRGAQILNVALGGTLYQDIKTQHKGALTHRDWEIYDQNFHGVAIKPNTLLRKLYGIELGRTNSIHHQGIKDLGPNVEAEAHCPDDGVIEAIRYQNAPFVFGLQWHPEFQKDSPDLLDGRPLLQKFLAEAKLRT